MLASAKLVTLIWTSRIPEAERFYGDVLGLPLAGRSHGALVYRVGGGDLRVSPVPATQPSAHTVMGFAVQDAAAAVADLSARGVAVTPEGAKVAWFRDPDGNLLSVVQYA